MRYVLISVALLTFPHLVMAQGQEETRARKDVPILLPTPGGEGFQIMPDPEGILFEELLMAWTEATGDKFSYRPKEFQGRKVHLSGIVHVKNEDVGFFFESILLQHGFLLTTAVPGEAALFSVESVNNSRLLKQTATWVPRDRIAADASRHPARLFMTVFTFKEIDVVNVRMALQNILQNRTYEFVQEAQSSNALVCVATGTTLGALDRLVSALDQPLPPKVKEERGARSQRGR